MKSNILPILLGFLLTFTFAARALDCARHTGERPDPRRPAGQANRAIPIEHILVIMQENHSFDNYFGRLNQPQFYGDKIDGISSSLFNLDESGRRVTPYHLPTRLDEDLDHGTADLIAAWNHGRNDLFARKMGARSMSYMDQRELPFYYALANQYAVADRYFSSVMSSTWPNRFFLYAATAFGHLRNEPPRSSDQYNQTTIFDVLDHYGISWKYYSEDTTDFAGGPGYLSVFQPMVRRNREHFGNFADYRRDLNGKLPAVVFLESGYLYDEHPASSVYSGEKWVAGKIEPWMKSEYWKNSVLFLTFDENGGFYDHVAPPAACAPDGLRPEFYEHYGFRVPFVAVSPYAKRHYVSHVVYDHTSILKFIETKFNLPALTDRDANAADLTDLMDWSAESRSLPPPESD